MNPGLRTDSYETIARRINRNL